jgi:hypothetical protein
VALRRIRPAAVSAAAFAVAGLAFVFWSVADTRDRWRGLQFLLIGIVAAALIVWMVLALPAG